MLYIKNSEWFLYLATNKYRQIKDAKHLVYPSFFLFFFLVNKPLK